MPRLRSSARDARGCADCPGSGPAAVRKDHPGQGEAVPALPDYRTEDNQRVLEMFKYLRVADVSDGMDVVGLQDVGLVDPEIHALWKDTDTFAHRVVGIAVTARYVPTNRREPKMDDKTIGRWYSTSRRKPSWRCSRPVDPRHRRDGRRRDAQHRLDEHPEWQKRGMVGLVTSGGLADTDEIIHHKVPMYFRRLARGSARAVTSSVGEPAGDDRRRARPPGDVVTADGDGVAVVPRERAVRSPTPPCRSSTTSRASATSGNRQEPLEKGVAAVPSWRTRARVTATLLGVGLASGQGAEAGRRGAAELASQLTRDSKWTLTAKVPVGFPTFHPQGMVQIGETFFVSSVEVSRRRNASPCRSTATTAIRAPAPVTFSSSDALGKLLADLTRRRNNLSPGGHRLRWQSTFGCRLRRTG